jgi:hypothetical protein
MTRTSRKVLRSTVAAKRATRPRPTVRLVYLRPDAAASALEARLREVAARFERVAVETRTPADVGRLARWMVPGSPAVLVVRRGVVVGQVVGEDIPSRELELVVRRAIAP